MDLIVRAGERRGVGEENSLPLHRKTDLKLEGRRYVTVHSNLGDGDVNEVKLRPQCTISWGNHHWIRCKTFVEVVISSIIKLEVDGLVI